MTLFEQYDNIAPIQGKSNEWYTPARYIEAAREVMGSIDLDPASCIQANWVVKAGMYFNQEENGLIQPWWGNVWINPPYGRIRPELTGSTHSFQKLFAEKLLYEYGQGHIKQAILLSLGNPNSVWFQPFFDYILCFYRGHIAFDRPDGSEGHFGFPLAFVYLGPNEVKFIEVFSKFGRIAKAVDTPKPKPTMRTLWEVDR